MLQEFREQHLTWDKANRRIYENVKANASDSKGRKLTVQVLDNGVVEDLTGASLSLYWETRSKQNKGLDAFDVVDATQGIFELYYTTGMLSNEGKLRANLVLVDDVGRIVSDTFVIEVSPGIDEEAVESSDSFTALTKALVDVQNLEQNYAPRLNEVTAQLAQTEQDLTTKLQQTEYEATRKRELEDLSPTVLAAIEGGEGSSFNILSIPQDYSVNYKKTDFMEIGKNLFNPVKAKRGQVVDSLTGETVINASYSTYEFEVIAGNYLKIQSDTMARNWYFRHIAAYDSTGAFRADLSWNNNGTPKITDAWLIPSGVAKVIVTFENGYVDLPCMIFYGQSFSVYEPYMLKTKPVVRLSAEQLSQISENKYNAEQLIQDNTLTKEKTTFLKSNENIFEVGSQTDGYYLDPNGASAPHDLYYYTKRYPLANGQSISVRARGSNPVHMRKIAVYDAQGLPITELGFNKTPDVEFKSTFTATDARIASVAITVANTLANWGGCPVEDLMIAYSETVPTFFVDHAVVTTDEIGLSQRQLTDAANYIGGGADKLAGLTIVNVGDSIAAGDGNGGKGYAEVMAEEYGMIVKDYAYGGATLSKGISPTNNIVDQIDEAIATEMTPPDIVFINGRTNDMNGQYVDTFQTGAITANFDTTNFAYDLDTFTGSLEYILAKLKTNWSDAIVIFVSVHNMSSRDLVRQKELHDRTREVCEKWSVGLADIYGSGQMNTNIPAMLKYSNPTETQPLGDRTHPNDLGYREKYLPIIRQEVLKYIK